MPDRKLRLGLEIRKHPDGRFEAVIPDLPGFSAFVTQREADNPKLLMKAIGRKIEEFMNGSGVQ